MTLRTVTIRRDFGTYVELAGGLTGNERVILNPGDSVYQGAQVQVSDRADSAENAGGQSVSRTSTAPSKADAASGPSDVRDVSGSPEKGQAGAQS